MPYVLIARTGPAVVALLLAVVGLTIPSSALVGLLLVAMLTLVTFEVAQKNSREEIPVPTATCDKSTGDPLNEQHDEER